MTRIERRDFLKGAGVAGAVAAMGAHAVQAATNTSNGQAPAAPARKRIPIGASTYSFWQFRGEKISITECIEKAGAMGFDGVEILHMQMADESAAAISRIKRLAHSLGLPLIGFSTHQNFVHADEEERSTHIQKTLYQIELAARLGIPTMRLNTGRWRTIESFDDFMAKKGIEPAPPGHTDEEAFGWVIEAIEKILPRAEELGVVIGLENHWGLARTATGLLRIVETINSPWLQITLDTGNYLENTLAQIEQTASSKVPLALVQAKTYFGGGRWYALDLDYAKIAAIIYAHNYRGWISLEFEGNEDAATAVPKSLALLRQHFSG